MNALLDVDGLVVERTWAFWVDYTNHIGIFPREWKCRVEVVGIGGLFLMMAIESTGMI